MTTIVQSGKIMSKVPKARILVLCAHLRWDRGCRPDRDFLQPSAGLHIAARIDPSKYDITLYHEMAHGPFDVSRAGDYDLVFLSGIQKDFDRLRQLSFFFRKAGAVVCAGGSVCTLFPEFAARFFDATCVGTVDCVPEILRDYEGGGVKTHYFSSPGVIPEYRIDYSLLGKNRISVLSHLVETSRGCNYGCGFCSLNQEKAHHSTHSVESVIDSIENAFATAPIMSVRRWFSTMFFIDNHFAHDAEHTRRICAYLRKKKRLKGWSAMVTRDVLSNRVLLGIMRASRCRMLFSGIESLDRNFLTRNSKKQNLSKPYHLFDDIDHVHRLGILLMYGYLFDPRISTIESMKDQIRFLMESDVLIFPNFFSYVSPLLGTRIFKESARRRELLPNLRLRDLDGTTLAYNNSLEDHGAITDFSRKLFCDVGEIVNRRDLARKSVRFIARYRIKHPGVWYTLYRNNFRPFHQAASAGESRLRNFIGGEDILDPQYGTYPADIGEADYERYFAPVTVTDKRGNPAKWITGKHAERVLAKS